jgi:hypothetical protein
MKHVRNIPYSIFHLSCGRGNDPYYQLIVMQPVVCGSITGGREHIFTSGYLGLSGQIHKDGKDQKELPPLTKPPASLLCTLLMMKGLQTLQANLE